MPKESHDAAAREIAIARGGMSGLHGLSAPTIQKICDTIARFPQVEKTILYGSRAKGVARPNSDIDLVLFGSELNLRLLGRIDDAIDDLLLPYRLDLSIHHRITHPDLLEHIARVGIVLYEKMPTPGEALLHRDSALT